MGPLGRQRTHCVAERPHDPLGKHRPLRPVALELREGRESRGRGRAEHRPARTLARAAAPPAQARAALRTSSWSVRTRPGKHAESQGSSGGAMSSSRSSRSSTPLSDRACRGTTTIRSVRQSPEHPTSPSLSSVSLCAASPASPPLPALQRACAGGWGKTSVAQTRSRLGARRGAAGRRNPGAHCTIWRTAPGGVPGARAA